MKPTKSMTFVIMVVLIFGVAASPILGNDLAYAQTERSADTKEQREAQHASTTADREPRSGDRGSSEDRQQQRQDRFANLSDEEKDELRSKVDSMRKQRSGSDGDRQAMKDRFADMTSEERDSEIQNIREERKAEREANKNMTTEERQAHINELKDRARESRESRVSPYDQMSMGLDPTDIVCADGLELVVKVSNGLPRCLNSDTVVRLLDRGVVSYPE